MDDAARSPRQSGMLHCLLQGKEAAYNDIHVYAHARERHQPIMIYMYMRMTGRGSSPY